MIELPEAQVLARQMSEALYGKKITEVVRGNVAHKFVFYNHTPEEYQAMLSGRTLGPAAGNGSFILLRVEPDLDLMFGEGGERILLHASAASLPQKHHFLLGFADGAYLTLSVQGWGSAMLIRPDEFPPAYYKDKDRVSPLDDAFTGEYFDSLLDRLKPGDKSSVKYFLVSKPGVWGIGNGTLQDILYRAGLHPRHPAAGLSVEERRKLYDSIRGTLGQMIAQGGRNSEIDLYGRPGGYQRLMCNETAGQPCPACGTPIEKASYLGGAVYFCPHCQK